MFSALARHEASRIPDRRFRRRLPYPEAAIDVVGQYRDAVAMAKKRGLAEESGGFSPLRPSTTGPCETAIQDRSLEDAKRGGVPEKNCRPILPKQDYSTTAANTSVPLSTQEKHYRVSCPRVSVCTGTTIMRSHWRTANGHVQTARVNMTAIS